MKSEQLHVFTARFNPLRWQAPDRHYNSWAEHMLDSGVKLTVVELQFGERPFTCERPHVNHIGVRATHTAWTKENLINIGVHRVPEAHYICWCDSDVFFEKTSSWATETIQALQLYRFIQPWSQAIDRGPRGEVINDGRAWWSFCYQYEQGNPLVPDRHGWKPYTNGYPHPGFAWASTRRVLEYTGGLFELAGMGAADHSMALALVGKASAAAPKGTNQRYLEHLLRWEDRIGHAVHRRIGYANNVINHAFHGRKSDRAYLGRWEMFLRHGFNPDSDLKRNSYGVLEWAGNKPELEREWWLYLRNRQEDANVTE